MAEINAAYDLVRAAEQHEAGRGAPASDAAGRAAGAAAAWLIPPLRLALGPELLDTLNRGEDVKLVTPTSTWASPRAILAVTERRLLWLLDDAPVARVHSLAVPQRRRDRAPGPAQARRADRPARSRASATSSTIFARTPRRPSSDTSATGIRSG